MIMIITHLPSSSNRLENCRRELRGRGRGSRRLCLEYDIVTSIISSVSTSSIIATAILNYDNDNDNVGDRFRPHQPKIVTEHTLRLHPAWARAPARDSLFCSRFSLLEVFGDFDDTANPFFEYDTLFLECVCW